MILPPNTNSPLRLMALSLFWKAHGCPPHVAKDVWYGCSSALWLWWHSPTERVGNSASWPLAIAFWLSKSRRRYRPLPLWQLVMYTATSSCGSLAVKLTSFLGVWQTHSCVSRCGRLLQATIYQRRPSLPLLFDNKPTTIQQSTP